MNINQLHLKEWGESSVLPYLCFHLSNQLITLKRGNVDRRVLSTVIVEGCLLRVAEALIAFADLGPKPWETMMVATASRLRSMNGEVDFDRVKNTKN